MTGREAEANHVLLAILVLLPQVADASARFAEESLFPVRVRAGSVVRPDCTPLPKIIDGTLGDLILPTSSLIDEAERRELEAESVEELLPERSVVFAGLICIEGLASGDALGCHRFPQGFARVGASRFCGNARLHFAHFGLPSFEDFWPAYFPAPPSTMRSISDVGTNTRREIRTVLSCPLAANRRSVSRET